MKRIGNIFLTWKKGPGSRRIAVAKISQNATTDARFQYLSDNVEIAKKEGFNHYTGFPDLEKIYDTNVLEILGQRISRGERNDLKEFYDFWFVDSNKKNDVFYMLAQTQGILPTDNYEFLADFNSIQGLTFVSEISGLSYTKISKEALQVGDLLEFEFEPTNKHDIKAVVLKKDNLKLGYVKKIHSNVFYKSGNSPIVKVHHIERNGFIKRAFISIHY